MTPYDRLEQIRQMLEQNPEDDFLHYAAALEFKKRGDQDKAREIMEELIKRSPSYLATYYQLGKLLEDEEPEKAISVYEQGRTVAREQSDNKTLEELEEAIQLLRE